MSEEYKPVLTKFQHRDKVRKIKGYVFDGVIVSVFKNLNGDTRYVAELTTANGKGMLHIFSDTDLEARS